jgi:tetratricopeptide (TPR) repeat protein
VQGGTGTCPFLIGIGFFAEDDFHILQYFMRDFDEEPSMLLALREQLKRFELTVTYNGAAFDIPLLETRFTLARLDSPFATMSHFDMLFTARKLWRNGHGSCRLAALESELLSFFRGCDIPGAAIPRAYFDYLQRRPAPALQSIFTHNAHDVISLAALTVHACDRATFEPAVLDEPLDLFSLARLLESSPDWRRSIRIYEMALEGGLPDPARTKALENLAVLYRRAGDHNRSLRICEELMRFADFRISGYEGAAIYYERVARDYEAALRVLEQALARAENHRRRPQLKARWHRLQQKTLFQFPAAKS